MSISKGRSAPPVGYDNRMDGQQVHHEIRAMIDRWCDRRELRALAELLPRWIANNGLNDGWAELALSLRRISNMRELPDEEREQAKRLYVTVDHAVRNR